MSCVLPEFSDESYSRIKPSFERAFKAYENNGRSFMKFADEVMGRFGESSLPYLEAFERDLVKEGRHDPDLEPLAEGVMRELTNRTRPTEMQPEKLKDLTRFTEWVVSPEFALERAGFEHAKRLSVKIIEADLKQRYNRAIIDQTKNILNHALTRIAKKDLPAARRAASKAVQAMLAGDVNKIAEFEQGDPIVFTVAKEITGILNRLGNRMESQGLKRSKLFEDIDFNKDVIEEIQRVSTKIESDLAINPVKREVEREFRRDKTEELYPQNVRKLLRAQIRAAKEAPFQDEIFFNELRGKFKDSKINNMLTRVTRGRLSADKIPPLSRLVGFARNMMGVYKLGYRPIAGAINGVSGFGHIWTKVGTEYLGKAVKFLRTANGKAFIAENKDALGMDFIADVTGKLHTNLPWWHPLKLFGAPEPTVREHSLAAGYLYGKEKLGMSEEAAREFGRRAVRTQQFLYNSSAIPRILRSPSGKLVGQFKTWLFKELEFIRSLQGAEWLRYLGMQMALAGPRGIVYMLKSIPFLLPLGLMVDLEKWMEKNLKVGEVDLTRGVPGLFNIDISLPATFQLPNRPEDWAGPFLADAMKLWGNVMVPLLRGEDFVFPDEFDEWAKAFPFLGSLNPGPSAYRFVEWARGLAPAHYYWDQIIQSIVDPDGWVKDRNGNRLYQISSWYDRMVLATGASTVDASKVRSAEKILREQEQVARNNRAQLLKDIAFTIDKGENITEDQVDKLVAYGFTDIASAVAGIKAKKLTPAERAAKRALLVRKAESLGIFEEF